MIKRKIKYSKPIIILRKLFRKILYSEEERNFDIGMGFLKMNKVEGDYAEFGVFQGGSMISAYHFSKVHGLDMKFYGFDSFKGFPKPLEEEKNVQWKEGDYACSQKEVERLLISFKIPFKLIKGWYKDTLKGKYGINKLAFVHIDCDFYSSTKLVLKFIEPYLQNGTIILFDDYNVFLGNYKYGEKRAFEEFQDVNPQIKFYEIPALKYRKMFYCVK